MRGGRRASHGGAEGTGGRRRASHGGTGARGKRGDPLCSPWFLFPGVLKIWLTICILIHIIICVTFEWDENKNMDNIRKHNVPFEIAQEAFFDEKRIILGDKQHSKSEERFFCIGNDGNGIVTVRFTMRDGNIRIFGAGYWREGREIYEQKESSLQ